MTGGMDIGKPLGRRWAWVIVFGVIGLCLNLLPVPLNPGVYFFFGGASALVPGLLFGPLYGAASMVISVIPSALRWGFTEIMLLSVVCAVFLSYLYTRHNVSAAGSALLFWAVAGPITMLVYTRGRGELYVATELLIVGVSAVNSIVNALFAEVIAQIRAIQREATGRLLPSRPLEVYVRQLFSPLVAVPLVTVMIASGHMQSRILTAELESESKSLAESIDRALVSRVKLHEEYLGFMAGALATRSVPGNIVTLLHQHAVETFSFSDLLVYLQGMAEPLILKGALDPELDELEMRTGGNSASEYPALRPQTPVDSRVLSTSPSNGEASVRLAVPIAAEERYLGVLVGHVPVEALLEDIPVTLQAQGRFIWSTGSPVEQPGATWEGFPGQVVYASDQRAREARLATDSAEDRVNLIDHEERMDHEDLMDRQPGAILVANGVFHGDIRPLWGEGGGPAGGKDLVFYGGESSFGGSYYVVRDFLPAVNLLHQRLGGFVVLGLALLMVPLIGAPILSRRVAQPVAGLADLSVRVLSDRRLFNLLPETGEGIDEVRRLTHFLQQTAIETRQLYHRVTESRQAILEMLVSTLEARDEGTAGHSRRVVYYALRLASELGVSEAMMPSIGWGSLLHDIGKIAVPDSILRKKGPLTEEEWKVMRSHCEIGYKLVSKIEVLKTATEIVRYHHERWDGGGYPFGLEREAIPLSARIFAVADTLDAVTSPRPYRPVAHTFEQALAELQQHSGTQFDPAVVEAAVRIGVAGWARVRREASEEGIRGLIRLIGEASDVGADDYRPSTPTWDRAKMLS